MNPQDDPEARIRALEQPLADTARATELGTGTTPYTAPDQAYAPPPLPPMPPQAQGPYTPPGTALRGRHRRSESLPRAFRGRFSQASPSCS